MGLNKDDIEYRDSSKARIRTRLFIAILTGAFANWTWLFIIIGTYSFGESATMYKVLTHSFDTGEKLTLTSEERGRIMGRCFVAAIFAGLSTLVIAVVIKFIRDYIISFF